MIDKVLDPITTLAGLLNPRLATPSNDVLCKYDRCPERSTGRKELHETSMTKNRFVVSNKEQERENALTYLASDGLIFLGAARDGSL